MAGAAAFDLLLDKATSHLLVDTDWDAILQMCDLIQKGDPQAKYAIGAIKKKLKDNNPHVALYALEVLGSLVKNCGQSVRNEVASRQIMEELKDLVKKQTTDPSVRFKILYLIQAWAQAFRTEPRCKVIQDTYQNLKSDGHDFPEFKESEAMFFSAEKVPRWFDGDTCHRCRSQFALLINRKHHCRNCGQVFCSKCSSKTAMVPKVTSDKDVRVCDPCYELLKKKTKAAKAKAHDSSHVQSPGETAPSVSSQRNEQLQAEEELQLAIALSQSEAEEKERIRHKFSYSYYPKAEPTSSLVGSTLYSSPANASAPSDEDAHPELARYLNRPYWEKKQEDAGQGPTPSAPAPTPVAEFFQPVDGHDNMAGQQQYQQTDDRASEEYHQQFLKVLQNNVATFLNRIRSNQMRGRSVTNDSAVLSLFQSISNMHPQLLNFLNELEEKRLYYEGLQDKLTQVFDGHAALNALRDEHREKVRRAAEEAENQRRIQLAQKLEIMRQKKQEAQEMQRQQAIQRLQEQENERQSRLELQKHTVQMRAQMPVFPMSYAPVQGGGVAYPPFPNMYTPAVSGEGAMQSFYMGQPGQSSAPSGQYQATDLHNAVDTTSGQAATTSNPATSGFHPAPLQGFQVSQEQHQTASSGFHPSPPQGYQASQDQTASSGFHPAPPQGYQVSQVSQDQSLPKAQAAVPLDGIYQPFVMQNMKSALPGNDANTIHQQQLVYQQRGAPSGGHRQPQQQQPPQTEAQLISFD